MEDPHTTVEMEVDDEVIDEFVVDFERAQSENKIDAFEKLLKCERSDDAAMKIKEQCIFWYDFDLLMLCFICYHCLFCYVYSLAKIYTENHQFDEIMKLLKTNNDYFGALPKARTAKIVRSILDISAEVPDSTTTQILLCRDVIAWCVAEKRTFLKQRIEGKVSLMVNVY